MYPSELPQSVEDDVRLAGEVAVFHQLRTLSDEWHIFYSVQWRGRRERGLTSDGETDFILAHAEQPLLSLEVKGGEVAYLGHGVGWSSLDAKGGRRRGSKDAFIQARENRYALRGLLTSRPGWDHQPFGDGYGVVLPHSRLVCGQELPPHSPPQIIIDSLDCDRMPAAIDRLCRYWRSSGDGEPLGEARLRDVISCLDGHVQLPAACGYSELTRQIYQLTKQQLELLSFLSGHRRVLIQGCAGSGKTLLAMAKARQLAEDGQRVLLTCYNRRLAAYMAQQMPDEVTVRHFHGLCADWAREAGLAAATPAGAADQAYFAEVLPNLLVRAAERLGRRFDAIVIDEAQDLHDTYCLALAELLEDVAAGVVYLFYSAEQDLFTAADEGTLPDGIRLLVPERPYSLTSNCRTTQAIHRVAMACLDQPTAKCQGPEGQPVRLEQCTGGGRELRRAVGRVLNRWIIGDKVPAEQVVVLSGHSVEAGTPLAAGQAVGEFVLAAQLGAAANQVQVATVQSFKGLEQRAVILADLDESCRPDLRSVLHVGCTRAQERLAVIVGDPVDPSLLARLRAAVGPADADA